MVMDLAQQYDQTLQNTIGQSQRERNRALRQAQEQGTSQLSNVPGSSTWSDRGTSGFRGAGFQEISNPQIDTKTRAFLGNTLGDYTEGGKNQAGYYGTDNPYTQTGAYNLAKKGGYDYAPKTLQAQFQTVGASLPSMYGKSLANQSIREFGDTYLKGRENVPTRYNEDGTAQVPTRDPKSFFANINKYTNLGFKPGQSRQGWEYNHSDFSPVTPSPYGDSWTRGNTIVRYNPERGFSQQEIKQKTGLLGGIFKHLDPFLDKIDPLHNIVQKATTGESTTEGQSPYFQKIAPMIVDLFLPGVGSAISGLDSASTGNGKGVLGSVAGMGLSAGLNGVDLTGMGTTANAAATGAIKGGVSSAISGNNILRGALAGGVGSGVTSGLGSMFNNSSFSSPGAKAVGNFISGAGGSLASNLFKKNTGQGMLQSALISGLGRSLNGSPNTAENTKQRSNTLNSLFQRGNK